MEDAAYLYPTHLSAGAGACKPNQIFNNNQYRPTGRLLFASSLSSLLGSSSFLLLTHDISIAVRCVWGGEVRLEVSLGEETRISWREASSQGKKGDISSVCLLFLLVLEGLAVQGCGLGFASLLLLILETILLTLVATYRRGSGRVSLMEEWEECHMIGRATYGS